LSAEIEKREKKKNFRKFLEVQKRFLPLQSQRKRRENKKDKDGAMPSEYSGYGS